MKKVFCNICKVRIGEDNHAGTLASVPVIGSVYSDRGPMPIINITHGYVIDVDLCRHCIIDSIKAQDDRETKGD